MEQERNEPRPCAPENRKLIVFDLDGTVLNEYGVMSNQDMRAMQQAKQRGHCLVVATGRPLSSIPSVVKQLDCRLYRWRFTPTYCIRAKKLMLSFLARLGVFSHGWGRPIQVLGYTTLTM